MAGVHEDTPDNGHRYIYDCSVSLCLGSSLSLWLGRHDTRWSRSEFIIHSLSIAIGMTFHSRVTQWRNKSKNSCGCNFSYILTLIVPARFILNVLATSTTIHQYKVLYILFLSENFCKPVCTGLPSAHQCLCNISLSYILFCAVKPHCIECVNVTLKIHPLLCTVCMC